ncbi:nucleotide-binding domain-containing protein [Cylindrobasidium torrendii FP15055 ss-10]|uniref:Nucleotide-binding domain-containing protein n=1 Tax=Cylindrobasidium torrendii FP15055 ss-10 TaxID=1314674 RepID=A0A0D7B9X7_9AGAR|nr:nucleotide-binding domain-containing protein [Cylindrobasidium torrendii FP15055 ss-10]
MLTAFRSAATRQSHTCVRFVSTEAPRQRPSILQRVRTFGRYSAYAALSTAGGIVLVGGALFVHDAFTYSEAHLQRVPHSPLALHPETGGPKNLPIVKVDIGDEDDETARTIATRPRLVIVGGGWGAMGVLDKLSAGDYHVTVISAETFTTFTPLLPSAAVGTVQVRSLIEPIRKIIARLHGHFIQGKAIDIDMNARLLEVETSCTDGTKRNIYIPYDKLVVAVGSVSSTHGVPGLENCFQLKTIADTQAMRRRILDNFEAASLPTTTPEERKKLLSFVICGGGPTGVETAAEIYDFCQEDIVKYFPRICREEVSISVIQSREHILNTYSEAISQYAEQKFSRDGVTLITSARVAGVTPDHVSYTKKTADGKTETFNIPSNFVLWSTGIAMNPFTQRLTSILPNQFHKKAVETDAHLRVIGSPAGTVYAVGDCATIETSLVSHFMEFVREADKDKNGRIDFEEWQSMVQQIKAKIPMAEDHLTKVRELFELYDMDQDNSLSLNEVARLMQVIEKKITTLPATAQVAAQQGKYIGKKLHKIAKRGEDLQAQGVSVAQLDETLSKPFRYLHLGSLAYIGNAAVFDFGGYSFMGGLAAMYAWRSVYWNEQVSSRTRALLMADWVIRGVWGRDLSRL